MKSIKELLNTFFKKEEPKKSDPKPRLDHSLERFVVAQERMYPRALEEVKNGKYKSMDISNDDGISPGWGRLKRLNILQRM